MTVVSSEARTIHGQAEQARESGNFQKALELTDQATVAYQKASDLLGLAEVQASRFSTFKHLHQTTGDKSYLILAKHAALASVEIAEASGITEARALPYHNLGKYYEAAEDYKGAADAFKKAIEIMENTPPEMHNRPAVIADMKVHWHTAEYRAGDKSALQRAETVLAELENLPEISDYNKNVWVSGGHIRIAEMLREDNPQKAKEHLEAAKKIIDSDERLTLRKNQWEKLAKTFA